MAKLKFKTFEWPRNPEIYRETCTRKGMYSKDEWDIEIFEGMDRRRRVITGSGTFLGDTAYEDYQALFALFDEHTAGNLVHPVWGTMECYFTGLNMVQEPRENCVRYEFTFEEVDETGFLPH